MSDAKEYYPKNIEEILSDEQGSGTTSTTITINDGATETAKVLVPQFGSDEEWLREGKIDWRRFSHLEDIDPIWIAYFLLIPKYQGGDYTRQFAEFYANLMYSVNGRHKKLTVDMQKAVSGRAESPQKPKQKRSWTDRLLGRNKEEID